MDSEQSVAFAAKGTSMGVAACAGGSVASAGVRVVLTGHAGAMLERVLHSAEQPWHVTTRHIVQLLQGSEASEWALLFPMHSSSRPEARSRSRCTQTTMHSAITQASRHSHPSGPPSSFTNRA